MWDSDVYFLHTQLMVTNVRLPKIYRIHPERVWFLNLQILQQSESWNNASLQCCAVFLSHMTVLLEITGVMNVRNQTSQAFVTGSWSILWLFVPVCLSTIEYQVYQSVPNSGISGRFRSKLLKIGPTVFSSPFLKWWSSKHGVQTFYNCSTVAFAISVMHFFACPSKSQNQATVFAWDFSQLSNFSVAPAEIRNSNNFCIRRWYVRSIDIRVECTPSRHGQETM